MSDRPTTLRSRILSGLFWTGGARLLGQALFWFITIIVIRLLEPGDYGLLAMATVFVNLLVLVAEGGLGTALVQAPELDERKLRTIFGAVILIDVLLCVLQFAAAPAIARFFEEERLVLIMRVLSLQFLLAIFTSIPSSLLSRDLEFKSQSIIQLASGACGSLATLALALYGTGVWALIVGTLIAQLCQAVALNMVKPYLKRPDFSFREAKSLLVFGGQFTLARILWFIYSQADVFIAGKLLGKDLLGIYSVAMHLASLPVQRLSAIANQVAFPGFAQVQHDLQAVAAYLLMALRMLTFVSVPVLWGISCVAPEIVAVLLGPKWHAATLPLQLLPLVMPLVMLSPIMNTAFQGIGKGAVALRNAGTAVALMPVAFWIGAQWGLFGLCVAWLLMFPLVLGINFRRMLPLIGLDFGRIVRAMGPSALCGLAMYAAVVVARILATGSLAAPALMALLIAVGVAVYCAMAWLFNRATVREFAGLLGLGRA